MCPEVENDQEKNQNIKHYFDYLIYLMIREKVGVRAKRASPPQELAGRGRPSAGRFQLVILVEKNVFFFIEHYMCIVLIQNHYIQN